MRFAMTNGRLDRHSLLLLCRDEATIIAVLKVLEREDYLVEPVREPSEVLARLRQEQVAVLLADLPMATPSFLDRARAISPTTRQIVLRPATDAVGDGDGTPGWHLRREVHDALIHREQEQLNRDLVAAFDEVPTACALVRSPDRRLSLVNRAAAALAGCTQSDARNLTCHAFYFGNATPCPHCTLVSESVDVVMRGGRSMSASVKPLAGSAFAFCQVSDISTEVAANQLLVGREKLASLGTAAVGLAHEVNNSLVGILTFAHLAAQAKGLPIDVHGHIASIQESALGCAQIARKWLWMGSPNQPVQWATHFEGVLDIGFDLAAVVESATSVFRAHLIERPKVHFEVTIAPELPRMHGDSRRIGQVIFNLLQNSLHAVDEAPGVIAIAVGRKGGSCFIKVSDTGCGIPESNFPRLFDSHFTTRSSGSGMGLAIAHQIVRDHGGHFEVKSKVGDGTTFTVFLPIRKSERAT